MTPANDVRKADLKVKYPKRNWHSGLGYKTCMWFWECCRKVEAEVVSNSRDKLHKPTTSIISRPSNASEQTLIVEPRPGQRSPGGTWFTAPTLRSLPTARSPSGSTTARSSSGSPPCRHGFTTNKHQYDMLLLLADVWVIPYRMSGVCTNHFNSGRSKQSGLPVCFVRLIHNLWKHL